MKHKLTTWVAVALAMVAGLAVAGMDINGRSTFSSVIATDVIIPEMKGNQIVNQTWLIDAVTNGTITVYRPATESLMYTAVAGTNALVEISTVTSNNIQGVTPTTSDYFIFEGPSSYQINKISAIGYFQTNHTSYTMTDIITVSAGNKVFLCDDGDKLQLASGTAQVELKSVFTGFKGKPIAINYPAAVAGLNSGTFTYESK